MRLTCGNFFTHLIFCPKHADTKKDQKKALGISITLGILTLGLSHLICTIPYGLTHRKAKRILEEEQKILKARSPTLPPPSRHTPSGGVNPGNPHPLPKLNPLFETITPANIDQEINTHVSGWCENIKLHAFSLNRHVSDKGKVGYSCCFQESKAGWMGDEFEINNGRFRRLEKYVSEGAHIYIYFDNLDQYLKYLYAGNFYQGEHFKADRYIFLKPDNTEVVYHNVPPASSVA